MRLRKFRVKGFRCIRDSGDVDVGDIAALVGKNESGKTALLEALLLLNKDQEISPLDLCDEMDSELEDEEFCLVEGTFELTDEETNGILDACEDAPVIESLKITRCVDDDEPQYEYPDADFVTVFAIEPKIQAEFAQMMADLSNILKTHSRENEQGDSSAATSGNDSQQHGAGGMTGTPAHESINTAEGLDRKNARIENVIDTLDQLSDPKQLEQWTEPDKAVEQIAVISRQISSLGYDNPETQALLEAARVKTLDLFVEVSKEENVDDFIRENLHPRFVYFSEYKKIFGMIRVPQFNKPEAVQVSETLESGERLDRRETIANLFYLAELDPTYLEEIKGQPALSEKYLDRCGKKLSKALRRTWLTQEIDVEFRYSDGLLTVYVVDRHEDGTRTNRGPLQRRSEGFQWHFSFYVNFNAETQKGDLKEAILLLDEPCLHLHPAQQKGTVKALGELAKRNQILYTTHSPFMILDFSQGSILTVETDPSLHLSQITTMYWNSDVDTIIPIIHSLGGDLLPELRGFGLAEFSPPVVIVEGPTDYMYLTALAGSLLKSKHHKNKAQKILCRLHPVPANGSAAIRPLALFHHQCGYRVVAMYDNEPGAKLEGERLKKNGFPAERIVFVKVGRKKEADVEDLFTEDDYLDATNTVYKSELGDKFSPVSKDDIRKARESDSRLIRIVPALNAIWDAKASEGWGEFDKCKVCYRICSSSIKDGDEVKIKAQSLNRFLGLYEAIDAAIKGQEGETPQEVDEEQT